MHSKIALVSCRPIVLPLWIQSLLIFSFQYWGHRFLTVVTVFYLKIIAGDYKLFRSLFAECRTSHPKSLIIPAIDNHFRCAVIVSTKENMRGCYLLLKCSYIYGLAHYSSSVASLTGAIMNIVFILERLKRS